MLGELLAELVRDGAEGVHVLLLALKGGFHGLTGGQSGVAAFEHRLQLLGSVL